MFAIFASLTVRESLKKPCKKPRKLIQAEIKKCHSLNCPNDNIELWQQRCIRECKRTAPMKISFVSKRSRVWGSADSSSLDKLKCTLHQSSALHNAFSHETYSCAERREWGSLYNIVLKPWLAGKYVLSSVELVRWYTRRQFLLQLATQVIRSLAHKRISCSKNCIA